MSNLKKEFGHNLRLLRKARNLTQEKLAEMVNLNQRQLTRIETGVSFVSSDVLEKLVIALDVDIKQLFDFQFEPVVMKTGTDDTPFFKVIGRQDNVIVQRFTSESEKVKLEEEVTENPDEYLSNVAKSLNQQINAQHFENGKLTKTYIYMPDGSVRLIQNNTSDSNFKAVENLFNKIKKFSNNENQLNYINLAVESLTDRTSRMRLKSLIEGMELVV